MTPAAASKIPSAAACQIPAPACKHCDLTMSFVGKLPSVQQHPEVRVFRCPGCNHVACEET
jgi:hypothetical protein